MSAQTVSSTWRRVKAFYFVGISKSSGVTDAWQQSLPSPGCVCYSLTQYKTASPIIVQAHVEVQSLIFSVF